jgi:RNA polymerase-binding transcription factor DksA
VEQVIGHAKGECRDDDAPLFALMRGSPLPPLAAFPPPDRGGRARPRRLRRRRCAVRNPSAVRIAADSASGDGDVGRSASASRRDVQDVTALAWDLRVRQLESEFALSALPPAIAQSGSDRELHARARALADVRVAATRWAIKEIEAAHSRLESGEYGSCEWCSRPIPRKVLATAPLRRLCDRCQSRA